LWNTILKGDTWRGEIANTTKDGDRYIVEQTIAPVEDESGKIAHLAAVNADITERKDREHRYDAVFNQTYQFTGLLEPDGTLIEANESALTFGGLTERRSLERRSGMRFGSSTTRQPSRSEKRSNAPVTASLSGRSSKHRALIGPLLSTSPFGQ